MTEYLLLLVSTVLINNFVLVKFLGLCPFMGVSGKLETAIGMGLAVLPGPWGLAGYLLARGGNREEALVFHERLLNQYQSDLEAMLNQEAAQTEAPADEVKAQA